MENKNLKIEEVRILPYDTLIAEQYNLTLSEALLYGFFWNFLSKDCRSQIDYSNEKLGVMFKKHPGHISRVVKKLEKLEFIQCKYSTSKENGGQIRYISWSNFKVRGSQENSLDPPSSQNCEDPPSSQNSLVANNNIYTIPEHTSITETISKKVKNSIKDIKKENTTIISDFTSLDNLDKKGRNQRNNKIRLSSVGDEKEGKEKGLSVEEKRLYDIYKFYVRGNYTEKTLTVKEGLARALSLFTKYYPNNAVEKFKEAVDALFSDNYWSTEFEKEPRRAMPQKFFNQRWMESTLITQIDNKITNKNGISYTFPTDEEARTQNAESERKLEELTRLRREREREEELAEIVRSKQEREREKESERERYREMAETIRSRRERNK